ncbi:hypothetical protein GK3244 [Geobacillus kaustophilus HTA426]|uniref:Uncharacterized protein n=1 Tax=Geobacillus kaustophilus (strain HTA426) TaxID=235909 RepID=Q5KUV7_GEOKA|nr:hypothetical protein GK3244 [Geobacillus kaustophilus HTA426]
MHAVHSIVVDLQSCKNPGGSTTIFLHTSSLQPSYMNTIDRIFGLWYSENNFGAKRLIYQVLSGVFIVPMRD